MDHYEFKKKKHNTINLLTRFSLEHKFKFITSQKKTYTRNYIRKLKKETEFFKEGNFKMINFNSFDSLCLPPNMVG